MYKVQVVVLALLSIAAHAQDGSVVNVSGGPPSRAYQKVFVYSGANLSLICYAESRQRSSQTIIASAASKASPVVFTVPNHGMDLRSKPQVSIADATGEWSVLNGSFAATVISSSTFSIPVNTSGISPVFTGSVTIRTYAPLLGSPVWAVWVFRYDSGGNLAGQYWANGAPNLTNSCAMPEQYQ